MSHHIGSPRLARTRPLRERIRDFLAAWREGVERWFRRQAYPQDGEIPLLQPRCCRNHQQGMLP